MQADKMHDAMSELESKVDRKVARDAEMQEQLRRMTEESHHVVMSELESTVDLKVVKTLEEQASLPHPSPSITSPGADGARAGGSQGRSDVRAAQPGRPHRSTWHGGS